MEKATMNTQAKRCQPERGYTLLEMALAITILGIIMAGFAQGYAIYLRKEQVRTTDDNLKQITNALQRYKQLNGAFPCPAPLTAPRNDSTYGASTDCEDTSLPAGTAPTVGGTGEAGVAIALSANAALATPPRIRIGAIPFRALNLDENVAYDGYGSKYVYALTETMTDKTTFNPLEGGISIVDSSGTASLITPPDSAIFTVVSPGRDRKGAYDRTGNLTLACGADIDSENCDFGTNATFTAALESNGAGNRFDDRIIYFSELNDPMWARSETNPEDIGGLALENTGIGTGNQTPVAKVEIKDSGVTSGPAGTLRSTNGIRTNVLCPPGTSVTDTTNPNCFEPRNIGGDNTTGAGTETGGPGNGMRCPTGQYMSGIMDGRPICETTATVRCADPNGIITGVDANGFPTCTIPPCPTEVRELCGTDRTLPSSAIGTTINLSAGSTGVYTERWRCRNVAGVATWQQMSTTGACTCEPEVVAYGGNDCGDGFTGTFTWTFVRTCPDGNEEWGNDFGPATCTCAPRAPYEWTESCPNDNYDGEITYSWAWLCPQGDFDWSNPTITNTCSCNVPAQLTRSVDDPGSCPEGYTGTVSQEEAFNVSLCAWEPSDATNTCTCDDEATQTIQRDPPCETWEHVNTQSVYSQTRDGPGCSWGTETLVTEGTCSPNLYSWQIYSSPGGNPVSSAVGPMVGQSCTPAQYTSGATQTCSASAGSQFEVHRCSCRPAY